MKKDNDKKKKKNKKILFVPVGAGATISTTATAIFMLIVAVAIAPSFTSLAAQAQTANPAYTTVVDAQVISDPNQKGILYQVTAAGTIPKKPDTFINSKLCFGYAWIGDPDQFNGIGDPHVRPGVIATMGRITSVIGDPCEIGDPDLKKTWNTQTVTLAKPNGPVCIDSIGDPNERTSVRTNTLRTTLQTADAAIFPSTFELAASFEIQHDTTACPTGTTTGLKMVPISVQDPNE